MSNTEVTKEVITNMEEEEEDKPYKTYVLKVDPEQEDRAVELRLLNFSRPHMLSFHLSWFSFFMAFFIWFAIAPLLPEIKKTLHLDKQQVWTTNIVSVAGTIGVRFLVGPICDKYGPRIPMACILFFGAIPVACLGFVNSYHGLIALRFFIGLVGSSFVCNQYWCSRMFAKEIVGTANAISAGWGNLGGGVTHLVMGTLLFPLFEIFYGGDSNPDSAEKSWRTVCVVPAFVCVVAAYFVYKYGEDSPKGNYSDMKKKGLMVEVSASSSFRAGALNFNTWILFIHYACCFGVELTMYNAAALYFNTPVSKGGFGLSTERAAAIASIFGWFNVFSRGFGGFVSDQANNRFGMRGRLWIQFFYLAVEGALVIGFSHTTTLGSAIAVMVFFSLTCQGCCGTSFGIVPYIDPANNGSLSGIIGAGGNVGAMGFGLAFKYLSYQKAFEIMGITVLASSALTALINIPGHRGLFHGQDDVSRQQHKIKTLQVPPPPAKKNSETDEEEGPSAHSGNQFQGINKPVMNEDE